jgi:hypothetical protein
MGWTYVESAYSHTASGATITPAESITVSTGDLIVIQAGTAHATVYSDDAYDDASNSYTHMDMVTGNSCFLMTSYAIASTGGATAFTAHFTASSGYWGWVMISVFHPDSGDTVSFDVTGLKILTWGSGTQTTSTADTTGTDEVIVAGVFDQNGVGFSNQEIPSATAATVLSMSTWNQIFYRIATATISSCCAEVDLGGNTAIVMEFVAFKATAGAGGTAKAKLFSSIYQRRRVA